MLRAICFRRRLSAHGAPSMMTTNSFFLFVYMGYARVIPLKRGRSSIGGTRAKHHGRLSSRGGS